MSQKPCLVAAGNTLAPALSELRKLGFSVSRVSTSEPGAFQLRAESESLILVAGDTVQLLGLAAVAERRGPSWTPTDAEVDALLELEASERSS
jgi:hypothetical protein